MFLRAPRRLTKHRQSHHVFAVIDEVLFNGKGTPTYDTFDSTVRGLTDFGAVNSRFRGKAPTDRPEWAQTA